MSLFVFKAYRNKIWRFVCMLNKRSYSGRWWRLMLKVLESVIKIKSNPKLKPVQRHFWNPCSWSTRPHRKHVSKKTLVSLSWGLKRAIQSFILIRLWNLNSYPASVEWSILSIECHCWMMGLYNQLRGIKWSFKITSKSTGWLMRYCNRRLRNGCSYFLPWGVCKNGSLPEMHELLVQYKWLFVVNTFHRRKILWRF